MLTNEPIRPEALELLRRLDDAGAFVEALKEGSLAGLTAGGRLLEREERELLASVTWAELLAHSEQLRARVDMHAQLEALMRELHTLLEPELSAVPGRSPEDAFDLVDPDRQAKAAELRQRIDTLMLLVDPGARTGRELAEAYLAGRWRGPKMAAQAPSSTSSRTPTDLRRRSSKRLRRWSFSSAKRPRS